MIKLAQFIIIALFISISSILSAQTSEIMSLGDENVYEYKSYFKDGSIKSIIGFYSTIPFSSVEGFEKKLKKRKVKLHGKTKRYYRNGQLKSVEAYENGKEIENPKYYFEDGEEYILFVDELPKFQFEQGKHKAWFKTEVRKIESKYNINLENERRVLIVLSIENDGTIKTIDVIDSEKQNKEYLMQIAEQIKVISPAKKDGEFVATKSFFFIKLK